METSRRPRLLLAADGPAQARISASARAQGYETFLAGRTVGWSASADGVMDVNPVDPVRLVAAAMDGGADILHPGIGGRARDAVLAREAVAAGLGWAGGRIGELEDAADRLLLNRIARDAGIVVLPGERFDDRDEATEWIRRFGVPFTVRPGDFDGRGPGPTHLRAEDLAGRIALSGRGPWLLERVWPGARRVGVVVIGDGEGEALIVGDLEQVLDGRGCLSIALAPAPGVPDTLREHLREAALRFAERAWPLGIATVWFSVAADERFAFQDAGSGLPDGWTVIDRSLGVDLVHFQLAVVAAQPLGWSSADLKATREAVEVVVHAADAGIATCRGRGGWHARNRSGQVYAGDELARIVWDGPTLHAALVKAVASLRNVPVTGVATNAESLIETLVARWG